MIEMISVFIFALVGVGIVYWIISTKKRRKDLKTFAQSLNFSFVDFDDGTVLGSLPVLPLFSQGGSRRIYNLVQGTAKEINFKLFDYRYRIGSGKHSHTYYQTVMLFQSPALHLPSFVLRPENIFHKIGSVFGYQDIDFEMNPVFSKQYLLRGEGEHAIRKIFTENILAYYERQQGLSTEARDDQLILYRSGKIVAVDQIRSLMDEAFQVFALFKD